MNVTLLIVDLWQSCACFLYRSGVTRCTLLMVMVLYLDHMCQCGLHAVLWPHIDTLMTLMHCLAAEPRNIAGLLFPSRFGHVERMDEYRIARRVLMAEVSEGRVRGTPRLVLFLEPTVWDWRVSRAGPMLFYWHKLLYPYYSLILFFPFSSFCL